MKGLAKVALISSVPYVLKQKEDKNKGKAFPANIRLG
jgi:hypothetical protein